MGPPTPLQTVGFAFYYLNLRSQDLRRRGPMLLKLLLNSLRTFPCVLLRLVKMERIASPPERVVAGFNGN